MGFRLFTATFLLVVSTSVAAAPVVVVDRTQHARKISAIEERVAQIHDYAERADSRRLLGTLNDVDRDSTLDPAIRDHLLEVTILALSKVIPGPDERQAIQRFRNRPVDTYVRIDDEHGRAVVPLYDLAAASRLTFRVWDTAQAKSLVAARIRAARWRPDEIRNPVDGITKDDWAAGTLSAIESADSGSVASLKSALLESQKHSGLIDPLLHAAARRTGDADLYRALILRGNLHDARAAIGTVNASAPNASTEILIAATGRTELASSAILALGENASSNAEIYRWLLQRLGNPTDGASAALALARELNDESLGDIRRIILGNQSDLTKLRAALVLRLSESSSAGSLRSQLQAEPRLSEQLRRALR